MGQLSRTITQRAVITVVTCLLAAGLLLPASPASGATTTLTPSAAGASTGLTPFPAGAGTNYLRVQTNDGNTSYVTSGTSAAYLTDLYNLSDVTLSGTINSVNVTMVTRANNTPTQASAYTTLRTNGVTYNGTALTVTTTYTAYSTVYATNPNTGSAWTWTDINNLQAGVALRRAIATGAFTEANRGTRCTQVYVTVDYTPPVPPTVTTGNSTLVEETTATLNGNITSTGGENADYRGFEWDIDSGAPYSTNWTESGNFTTGNFTRGLTSLTKGELYYFRAIAHNSAGWGYGSESTFLTKPDEPNSFNGTAGDQQVQLTWVKGDGAQTTIVRGKIDSYPANYDTDVAVYSGNGTSVIHSGLNNGDHWYYRTWSYTTEGGLEQYSDLYVQADAIPIGGPSLTTDNATSVEETTATLNGNITSTGGENADYRGFEWDIDSGVPYSNNWTENGSFGTGNFTYGLSSLTKGELYYFRAIAHNSAGWGYGSENTFLTKPDEPNSFNGTAGDQQVQLAWVKGAGAQTTIVRGKIDSYPTNYDTDVAVYSGNGTNVSHSGLNNGDHWYYRAWSYSTEGALEQYSDLYVQADATPIGGPSLTTDNATSVEETTATLNGNITSTGGSTVDYRGFEWDIDSGAPYSSNWTESGNFTTGVYTHGLTSLAKGTLYYFRALAHNSVDWGYGTENTFLTKPDEPNSLNATAGDQQVQLAWVKGAGAQTTIVRGKIDSYPTNYDTDVAVYSGNGTNVSHSGLNNGDHWYYRAWSYTTEGGLEQYSDLYVQADAIPMAVATLTTNNATSVEETTATLNGTLTSDGGEACQYRFEYDTDSGEPYSFNTPWTGSITSGQSFSADIFILDKGTKYYFRAQVRNGSGTFSGTELTLLTKPDAPSAAYLGAVGGTQIELHWTKGEGTQKTMILRKTGGFPADRTDGTLIYFNTGTSALDTGLSISTTYYYRLWSQVSGSEQFSDEYTDISATTGSSYFSTSSRLVGGEASHINKLAVLAPFLIIPVLITGLIAAGVFRLRKRIVPAINRKRP